MDSLILRESIILYLKNNRGYITEGKAMYAFEMLDETLQGTRELVADI